MKLCPLFPTYMSKLKVGDRFKFTPTSAVTYLFFHPQASVADFEFTLLRVLYLQQYVFIADLGNIHRFALPRIDYDYEVVILHEVV